MYHILLICVHNFDVWHRLFVSDFLFCRMQRFCNVLCRTQSTFVVRQQLHARTHRSHLGSQYPTHVETPRLITRRANLADFWKTRLKAGTLLPLRSQLLSSIQGHQSSCETHAELDFKYQTSRCTPQGKNPLGGQCLLPKAS